MNSEHQQYIRTDVFYTNNPITDVYFSSLELIYNYTTKTFLYSFEVTFFNFLNIYGNYSIDSIFIIILEFIINLSSFQLFFSVLLDLIISNDLYKNFFLSEWYKCFISYQSISLYFIYHPELIFLLNFINNEFNINSLNISYIDLIDYTSWVTPSIQFIDMLFSFYLVIFLLLLYFSYYNNYSKENNTIDSDYLNTWVLVESEKEVGSLDDLLLALLIVANLFGWFFYIYIWNYLNQYPELLLSFYLFPFLIFLMVGVPVLLIIDFGSCFLVFIRGGSANQMFLPELIYDYINVGAFFLRLCLQLVRLFLMFLTYAAMCDVFFFDHNLGKGLLSLENIWNDVSILSISLNSFFYVISDILPKMFIRFLFEIGHTIAVCSIQFTAFFAIVFWFFLFLYTFFCALKLEFYFKDKRCQRKN